MGAPRRPWVLLLGACCCAAQGGPPAPVPLAAPPPAAGSGSSMPLPSVGHDRARQPRYALDVEKCVWQAPKSVPYFHFRDGAARASLPELVGEGVSPTSLKRAHVDLVAADGGQPQTCPVTTLATGVISRFAYALVTGDVVTDCDGGSVIADGIGQRPDMPPDLYPKTGHYKQGVRAPPPTPLLIPSAGPERCPHAVGVCAGAAPGQAAAPGEPRALPRRGNRRRKVRPALPARLHDERAP